MKNFFRAVYRRICFFADGLALLGIRPLQRSAVVIVKMDLIGDFVLWLDSAKTYRELFPEQKLTLIANSSWAELAAALRYWDEVRPVNLRKFTRNLPYRWKVLRDIKAAGFAIAIQPTFSRGFLHGDSMIRATGADRRIGSTGDESNTSAAEKVITNRIYTQLLPATAKPLMELERNAEFISHLSGKTIFPALPELPVMTKLPADLHLTRDYFIIFPGASWVGKQWPTVSFARLLEQIQAKYGWQPVLCGGPADLEICAQVAAQTQTPCLNWAGKTTLPQLVEVIRGAQVLIGNDTSAVHIAAAVSTPSLCILGGGHYGRFLPYPEHLPGTKPVSVSYPMPCYHCNWNCSQPHSVNEAVPCIANISVAQAWAQLHNMLDKTDLSSRFSVIPD